MAFLRPSPITPVTAGAGSGSFQNKHSVFVQRQEPAQTPSYKCPAAERPHSAGTAANMPQCATGSLPRDGPRGQVRAGALPRPGAGGAGGCRGVPGGPGRRQPEPGPGSRLRGETAAVM